MLLADKIEYIFLLIDFVSSNMKDFNPVTRRMYAMGLINEMYQIESQLSVINERLETSLSIEDACLDLTLWEDEKYDRKNLLDEKMYIEDASKDADINRLTDLFPQDNEDYSFTTENAERFKTGMRYLCSDANLSPRNMVFALNKGFMSIISLLCSIKQKKTSIKDFQWEDFWYEFLFRDDDLWTERAIYDYEQWKEEHDWHDIQALKDKRTQEILKLLKSGVFKKDIVPVRRDIENSVITISEDALEDGTDVPDNIKIECARFSKYVMMKKDILCLDYMKLGKYVYKHYADIEDDVWDNLIYFDNMLLHIHDDMAECNPELKVYLKFYEDDVLESVLDNGLEVINSCRELLRTEVEPDFLANYLRAAFYGEPKMEVQSSLKGQSKYTIICNMLGMLKTTLKVFKLETTSAELAKALSSVVKKPSEDSLKRYVDKGASIKQSKLSKWTTQYVMDNLGNEAERLFVKISQE